MSLTPVILITGRAATGKTTLAYYLADVLHLPVISKDEITGTLMDTLGWSTPEWSRKLSMVSRALLYQQIELLLRAGVSHIVESNFDPIHANAHWQTLSQQYALRLIQIRCEAQFETSLQRYRDRIQQGRRHPGFADRSNDVIFQQTLRQGPINWVDVASERLSLDTNVLESVNYIGLADRLRYLLNGK